MNNQWFRFTTRGLSVWFECFVIAPATMIFIGLMYFGDFNVEKASMLMLQLKGVLPQLIAIIGFTVLLIKGVVIYLQKPYHVSVAEEFQKQIDRLEKQNDFYHSLQDNTQFVFLEGMPDHPWSEEEIKIVNRHNGMVAKIQKETIEMASQKLELTAPDENAVHTTEMLDAAMDRVNFMYAELITLCEDGLPKTSIDIDDYLADFWSHFSGIKQERDLQMKLFYEDPRFESISDSLERRFGVKLN